MTIVTTQTLQVLVASAAMMRMRMIMRVRVAGEIVRAVRVAATVAHLDRGINQIYIVSLCSCSSRLSSWPGSGSLAVYGVTDFWPTLLLSTWLRLVAA